ncbi:MAG: carboxymuconolactone decarboxylase family protein [Myxococcota bacterium]
MSEPKIHDVETAPEQARPVLEAVAQQLGFVPNVIGLMAEAPAAAKAYAALSEAFSESSLSPVEQQTVLLAAAFENRCDYCMAAHSWGFKGSGGGDEDLKAIRAGQPMPTDRLEALRRFAGTVVARRGWLSDGDLDRFLEAGFERSHALEVLVGVAQKTLSNYTNHIFDTPLDEGLREFRWEAPADD